MISLDMIVYALVGLALLFLIIKLLNSTNTVIIIAGIVANDSTEANPILGF